MSLRHYDLAVIIDGDLDHPMPVSTFVLYRTDTDDVMACLLGQVMGMPSCRHLYSAIRPRSGVSFCIVFASLGWRGFLVGVFSTLHFFSTRMITEEEQCSREHTLAPGGRNGAA